MELMLNNYWCFFWEYYLHIFSNVSFKGVIKKQAATSSQATSLPIPNFKFLFALLPISKPLLCFNDHPKVNALLISCSSKEEG